MLISKSCELHKVLGDNQSFSFTLFPLLFIHPALSNGWRCFYQEVEAAQGCEINHHWPDHLIPPAQPNIGGSSLFQQANKWSTNQIRKEWIAQPDTYMIGC